MVYHLPAVIILRLKHIHRQYLILKNSSTDFFHIFLKYGWYSTYENLQSLANWFTKSTTLFLICENVYKKLFLSSLIKRNISVLSLKGFPPTMCSKRFLP